MTDPLLYPGATARTTSSFEWLTEAGFPLGTDVVVTEVLSAVNGYVVTSARGDVVRLLGTELVALNDLTAEIEAVRSTLNGYNAGSLDAFERIVAAFQRETAGRLDPELAECAALGLRNAYPSSPGEEARFERHWDALRALEAAAGRSEAPALTKEIAARRKAAEKRRTEEVAGRG